MKDLGLEVYAATRNSSYARIVITSITIRHTEPSDFEAFHKIFLCPGVVRAPCSFLTRPLKVGVKSSSNPYSFTSPDSVNKFDWTLLAENASTYNYVKKVIALRKAHAGFRFDSRSDIETSVKSDQRSESLVYTLIDSAANGDAWEQTLVIFNAGGEEVVDLPPGEWTVALENSSPDSSERSVSGLVTAAGTAVTILYQ